MDNRDARSLRNSLLIMLQVLRLVFVPNHSLILIMKGFGFNSVPEVVQFILCTSKFLFLFPFRFDGKKYVLSQTFIIMSALSGAINVSTFIYLLLKRMPVPMETYLSIVINYVDSFLMLCVPLLVHCDFLLSLSSLNDSLSDLAKVEKLLLTRKEDIIFYKCPVKYTCLNAVLLAASFVCSLFDDIHSGRVAFMIQTVYYCCLFAQMMGSVYRFSALLDTCTVLLNKCCNETLAFSYLTQTNALTTRRLEVLVQAHSKLCRISCSFHQIQKHQIFLIISISFIIFTTELYEVYNIFMSKDKLYTIFMKTSWIVGCFCMCWKIVESCTSFQNEVRKYKYFTCNFKMSYLK